MLPLQTRLHLAPLLIIEHPHALLQGPAAAVEEEQACLLELLPTMWQT